MTVAKALPKDLIDSLLPPLRDGIERARQLTEQLLSLARTQAGSEGESIVNVPAMARELIAEYRPQAKVIRHCNWFFMAILLSGIAAGASQVAPVDKLSVVFAVVFLGEALTVRLAIGSVLIISGALKRFVTVIARVEQNCHCSN